MRMIIFVGLCVLGATLLCVLRFTLRPADIGAGGGFGLIIRCCCRYTQEALSQ